MKEESGYMYNHVIETAYKLHIVSIFCNHRLYVEVPLNFGALNFKLRSSNEC